MDWLLRLVLLAVSIALGVESVERDMAALQPPAMKMTLVHRSAPQPALRSAGRTPAFHAR